MRISRIRLAGFKSFVDPTHIDLPNKLTGIVGPNGCGKSNIIDAMLWVLGESSAKHLRGDSMADVIFNGSNTRKPVGQASVEIVFDNSDGTLRGQYTNYSEVSVKRQLGRDGVSIYYLNGGRCRRKDVVDVFLGTGVGKGGYSVIEQGMISRVIEARPEEMRGFLEEAAGISKYKERRRETETRIKHTKENLDRLNDIRSELEKQLDHLSRQARSAERYHGLKSEERSARAQLLAIRWRDLDRERQRENLVVAEHAIGLAQALADLRNAESTIIAHRDAQNGAADELHQIQSRYYSVSAEISRCEQALQHAAERREELRGALDDARRALADAEQQVTSDSDQNRDLGTEIDACEPQWHDAKFRAQQLAERRLEAERLMQEWQESWERFAVQANETARTERLEQLRLEHIQAHADEIRFRRQSLCGEQDNLRPLDLQGGVDAAVAALKETESVIEIARADREMKQRLLSALLGEMTDASDQIDTLRTEHQSLRGRISSLQQLQDAALGRDQAEIDQWLDRHAVSTARRLAEEIQVAPGWEFALETVLRLPLDTFCGVDMERALIATHADPTLTRRLGAINDAAAMPPDPSIPGAELLLAKVTCRWSIGSLLAGIYAVASKAEALSLRERLAPHESIVTPDGTWVGPNWIQIAPAAGGDSILQREKALQDLLQQADQLEVRIIELRAVQEHQHQRRAELESDQIALDAAIRQRQEWIADRRADLARKEAQRDQAAVRLQVIETELDELDASSSNDASELTKLESHVAALHAQIEVNESQREALQSRRAVLRERLEASRQELAAATETVHQFELRLGSARAKRAGVQQSVERYEALRQQLRVRCDDLEVSLHTAAEPNQETTRQLDTALAMRQTIETELTRARNQMTELDGAVRAAEQVQITANQLVDERRSVLENSRLDVKALEVKCADLEEQIEATEFGLQALLAEIGEASTEGECTERLESLERRISRLGPINLAALDEYSQTSERKSFLDRQLQDLTDALATLHEAMKKIDRETRTRFKEVFDSVNIGLQQLFPALFGGGHAYLEMTDTDLLETGVAVMARPPGKKNSTIHLLSGGEKALTAIAFVFSLFRLNPAPFCLLDEVDAPLDDANVIRFCQLVKEMSEEVQFLVVTHNKITMEIAEQLIGVTMQEAGVSRLVSVNMDEAIEMAVTA